jgi:hypothetical protein
MNISSSYSPSTFAPLPGLSSRDSGVYGAGAPPAEADQSADLRRMGGARASPLSPVAAPSAGARAEQDKSREAAQQVVDKQRQAREEQLIQKEIKTLAARDREVRTHEQAHMAAGGQYAGAATYEYQRGPNGVNYAVGGEVPISTSEEATPQATLRKAQIIRRAALAPAEPSPQDRRVAAMATQMESAARAEIARESKAQLEQAEARSGESVEPKPVSQSEPAPAVQAAENAAGKGDQLQRIYRVGGGDTPSTGTLFSLMV